MVRLGVFMAFALIAVMGGLVFAVGGPRPSSPASEPLGQRVAADQSLLDDDMGRVRRYAEGHPDTYAGIQWENEPMVRIVVGFTGDLEPHRRALPSLVEHPDRVEVVSARRSRAELAHIRAEIEPEVFRLGGPGVSLGETFNRLSIRLRADGESLAASLHQRYGGALDITVGGKPYPPAAGTASPCARIPAVARWDDVELRLSLHPDRLQAGGDGRATLTIHNRSSRTLEIDTDQPLVASVIESGGDRIVGTYVGVIAGTGLLVRLAPGEGGDIAVLVGSASCEEGRYALAAGRYDTRVVFTVREGPTSHTLVSPAAPLVVE